MITTFIKNHNLLKEDSHVEDLFDFSEVAKTFEKKLDSIPESSIIGLIGKFGMGKSTMLYNIQKKREKRKKDERWFEFDAWKYPERKDLWEGFILDFTKDVLSEKRFKKLTKEIEGNKYKGIKDLISVLSKGLNLVLPGSNILENLNLLFHSSSIKRVFEFQRLFLNVINEQIKEHIKNIFTIIEDIDGSGDRGIFFLETLNNFLKVTSKDNKLNKKVIIIVPIGTLSFHEKIISYQKCLDYIEFFNPEVKSFDKFLSKVIKEKFLNGNSLTQLSSFFEYLLLKRDEITIRTIKLILRKAEISYIKLKSDGFEPDIRVIIAIETSKFLKNKKMEVVLYDYFKEKKVIYKGIGDVVVSFLSVIYLEEKSVFQSETDKTIRASRLDINIFDNLLRPNIEKFNGFEDEFKNSLIISSRYFYE